MRNFVISVICLSLLVGVWCVFDSYSDKTLHGYIEDIEDNIIIAVEDGKWDQASVDFEALSVSWHKYKKSAAFFLDTQTINDTDYSIAKAKYYIKAKDDSNSTGELNCLKEQLTFLDYNESLNWGNIF